MRILAVIIICLLSLSVRAANPAFQDFNPNQFGTSGNKVSIKSGALLTNTVSWSNNIVVEHNETITPYPNIHAAANAAVLGDWVKVYGSRIITTNNWLRPGVNYEIYPPVVYVESSTSSAGLGILDDRGTGATTNWVIFHSDAKYSAGTNGPISFNSYLGNDNCKGAIVSTNSRTEWHIKGAGLYGSDYDTSNGDGSAIIVADAISTNSIMEFDSLDSFALSFDGVNQLSQVKTLPDLMNGWSVTTNGFVLIVHNRISPGGTYSIVSTLDDPTINANIYFSGAAKLTRKIYFDWSSPNWRAWLDFTEVNTSGASQNDCMSFYGAGKVYVNCQKASCDSGVIVNTQAAFGTSNIEVWVKSDKFECGGTAVNYAGVDAGFVDLQVSTYTNSSGGVTNGFLVRGGRARIHDGIEFINGTNSKGIFFTGGQAELINMTLDTSSVNIAGNNPASVTSSGLHLKGCTLLAPALADSIISGAANNVGVGWSLATTAKNANITLSPNAGFTVDSAAK